MDLPGLPTEHALAAVLGRLSPRDLAASRCVCRAWRSVVDARRLLRTDLLPFSLGGIFFLLSNTAFPPLLSCPSPTVPAIWDNVERFSTGDLSFGPLKDHCNGLLLFSEHVVNPATGRWARLPPPPPPPLPPRMKDFYHRSYLMYDPAVSPHYEVLLVPTDPCGENLDPATEEAEWPPSSCAMRLFSSRTGRWEERSFKRHGPAMGTVYDLSHFVYMHCNRYGVYWRGALYLQCHQNNFVMRINLSAGNYHLIEPPEPSGFGYCELHLGKSEKGVYYAIPDLCRLLVWSLDESNGQMQWVLKCDRELNPRRARPSQQERPWLLDCYGDDNYLNIPQYYSSDDEDYEYAPIISETDTGYAYDEDREDFYGDYVKVLGFHPFKEVVFLDNADRVLAYHLSTSKMEYLGSLWIGRPLERIVASYVYTPCWMRHEILEQS